MSKLLSSDWSEISALLDIALDLPAEEREGWLEFLIGRDAKHVSVLRDLLSRDRLVKMEGFLSRLPEFSPLDPQSRDEDAPSPGTRIGPYFVIRLLGRGGMSTVYLAIRRDDHIKREVALKVPHTYLLQSQPAERLVRERDILAALTHPNIARLYDAGVSEEGRPFLAMEYVDGTPLIDFCDQARLGIERRLELFMQVLAAVRHAHSKLVLHRDLKPSNILVTAEGRVLLLDFGIAKLIADEANVDVEATQFGERALTPAYASPEQIVGQPLGTASDVYSLGVILYELLTGRRPYQLEGQSAVAVEDAILNAEAPHLTESIEEGQADRMNTTAARLRKALHGDLDAIVRKSLRKSAATRYGTSDELARDLAAYADGQPVSAHAESRNYLLRKFIGRHKVGIGATAAIFVALAIGGAVSVISARAAIVQRDRALALASRNEAISVFLKYLIADAAEGGKPVTISDMLKRSEALIVSENSGNLDHQAAVLDMLGNEYRTTGEFNRAEALLGRAVDLATRSHDPELKALVSCDHAGALDNLNRQAEADAILRSVLKSEIRDPRVVAGCLEELADSADAAEDYTGSLQLSLSALQTLRQAHDISHGIEAEYIGSVALELSKNGRNQEADQYFADALGRLQALGRENSGTGLVLMNDYGVAMEREGNPRKAIAVLSQVLEGLSARDPNAQPWVATLINLGRSQEEVGRFAEASATHQRCIELAMSVGQSASAQICLYARAVDALDLHQPALAQSYVTQALDMSRALAVPDRSLEAPMHIAVGGIAAALHQLDKARLEYDAILSPHDGVPVPSQNARLGRARVNLEKGAYVEAMQDAQAALDIARKRQGKAPHSSSTALAWTMIARIRSAQGDHAGARDAAQRAVTQFSDTVDPDLPQYQWVTSITED